MQKSILEKDELVLSYQDNVFSFEFAALNFNASESNRYKYKMEGFDEEWIETTSDRHFASYTNLDSGDYVFRVIASNNDGVWNEEGASIKITITPPWWQTIWFRIGLGVLVIGLLTSGFRWRVRYLQARSRELEAQVHTLFENSPLGIALSTFEGKILTANKSILEMLRITEEEILQRGVLDFYRNPSDRETLLSRIQEAGFVQDFGVELVRNDDSLFFASLSMSKLVLGGDEVLLAMVEDVSKQVNAETALRESGQRSRVLFQSMPLSSYYWQRREEDFVLLDCNEAADVFTQGNVRKILGITLTALYSDQPDIVEDIRPMQRNNHT